MWLSKTIGFGGVRLAPQSALDSKLYFSTALLGHYYSSAGSEQCLIVLTAIQLESSLIATISTSADRRGYNRVIDHLLGNQSMRLLTKLSVMVPKLSGCPLAQIREQDCGCVRGMFMFALLFRCALYIIFL